MISLWYKFQMFSSVFIPSLGVDTCRRLSFSSQKAAVLRNAIKNGEDYTTPEGDVIPNARLTTDADPSRSYAYCSDTLPCPENIPYIAGTDLLYHEATFARGEAARATATFHSTAGQAAAIAKEAEVKKLVIGHFSSRYENEEPLLAEAKEIFPCTELAGEGKCFKIQ